MSATITPPQADSRLVVTGVRRLTPATAKMFEGAFSLLHCAVIGYQTYRGVFAVLMFPIRYPDRYISLRYTGEKDKVREIGVIDDLSAFSAEIQALIRAVLKKQYHEHIISRVYEVRNEFGLLFFDVETQRGRQGFMMPWRHDRAEDFGAGGKVLLDVNENRFIVPDVLALPATDQRRFTNYIYW